MNRKSVPTIIAGVFIGLLAALMVWNFFFRQHDTEPAPTNGGLGGVVTQTATPSGDTPSSAENTPRPYMTVSLVDRSTAIDHAKAIIKAEYTYDSTDDELVPTMGHDVHAFDGLVAGELKKTTDAMVLDWKNPKWGTEDQFKRVRQPNKMKSTIDFIDTKIGMSDANTMVVMTEYVLTTTVNGVDTVGDRQSETITFNKVNGKWVATSNESPQSVPDLY